MDTSTESAYYRDVIKRTCDRIIHEMETTPTTPGNLAELKVVELALRQVYDLVKQNLRK